MNVKPIKIIILAELFIILLCQDQNLGNWQVKRQVGSGAPIIFKFPAKFTLKAGQRVTVRSSAEQQVSTLTVSDVSFLHLCADQIWSAGSGGAHSPPSDLLWKSQPSWGSGDLFQTTLISANGEVLDSLVLMLKNTLCRNRF